MISWNESLNTTEILRSILLKLEEYSVDLEPGDIKVLQGLNELNQLNLDFLPYAAITQVVYNKKSEEISDYRYFILFYKEALRSYYRSNQDEKGCEASCQSGDLCKRCTDVYTIGMKVYEHLNLAEQQVASLFLKHQKEIDSIQKSLEEIDEVKAELKGITSNYVSILGIFAAILLTAFGAMQGFTSLFNNATKLPIEMLLMISGIGGLIVVSILHMMLHAIAKLSGLSIRSIDDDNAPVYRKYPFFMASLYAILVIIFAGITIKITKQSLDDFDKKTFVSWGIYIFLCLLPVILKVTKSTFNYLWGVIKNTCSCLYDKKRNSKKDDQTTLPKE